MLPPKLRGEPMFYDRQIAPDDDRAYFKRRAAEEAERAEQAITLAARHAHSALAAFLRRKAEQDAVDTGPGLRSFELSSVPKR